MSRRWKLVSISQHSRYVKVTMDSSSLLTMVRAVELKQSTGVRLLQPLTGAHPANWKIFDQTNVFNLTQGS